VLQREAATVTARLLGDRTQALIVLEETHVAHVPAKLGVESRTAAATLAHRASGRS
jgi:hypothetical protein